MEFTLQQVGVMNDGDCDPIDLTTSAGWAAAESAFAGAPAAPADPYCLVPGTDVVQVTDDDGLAVFDGLELGLYYVEETGTPTPDPGQPEIIGPVAPFYVTIPFPSGNADLGWLYDVNVYPKNVATPAPTKTIDGEPGGLTVGSTVTWRITVDIPTFGAEETLESASAWDSLDSSLGYVSSAVTVSCGDNPIFTDPASGSDPVPALVVFEAVGQELTWTFTEDGLERLQEDGCAGGTYEVELVTEVLSVGDGKIENNEYGSEWNGVPLPGYPTPFTFWGQLDILKTDNAGDPLKGAVFEVYPKADGANCPATPPSSGLVSTGISNENGVVLWTPNTPDNSSPLGLWVTNIDDWISGTDPIPAKDYCVYETKAPAGYTAGTIGNPVTITPGESAVVELTVVNTPRPGPELPLTGAGGKMLLAMGGIGLVAVAGGLYLARRRKAA